MTETSGLPAVSVAVGVLTYRRPDRLTAMLVPVAEQLAAVGAGTQRPVELLVVDNNPGAEARDTVAELSGRFPAVRYVHEPTPGIAAARQRALEEAGAHDLLQFIDDDEVPEDDWLVTMVRAWEVWGRPAGVAGSIQPRYLSAPPAFVRDGGFFVRRQLETGTEVRAASSANLLLDLAQLRELGLGFDVRLGLRGGEDSLLTTAITDAGRRLVFCREAVVHDLVPDDRNTRAWVLRRATHHGGTQSLVRLWDLPAGMRRRRTVLALVGRGLARAVVGFAEALAGSLTRSGVRHARGLRRAYRGLGMARGALAPTTPEYARPADPDEPR